MTFSVFLHHISFLRKLECKILNKTYKTIACACINNVEDVLMYLNVFLDSLKLSCNWFAHVFDVRSFSDQRPKYCYFISHSMNVWLNDNNVAKTFKMVSLSLLTRMNLGARRCPRSVWMTKLLEASRTDMVQSPKPTSNIDRTLSRKLESALILDEPGKTNGSLTTKLCKESRADGHSKPRPCIQFLNAGSLRKLWS